MSCDTTLDPIPQGNSRGITVVISTKDGFVDITDDDVNFMVKRNRDDADVDAAINITNSVGDHSDPVNGETIFRLGSTDTNITQDNYYYEITHIASGGAVTTLIGGRVKIIDTLKEPV